MASRTRDSNAGLTCLVPRMTLETVAMDTFARCATSIMVGMSARVCLPKRTTDVDYSVPKGQFRPIDGEPGTDVKAARTPAMGLPIVLTKRHLSMIA